MTEQDPPNKESETKSKKEVFMSYGKDTSALLWPVIKALANSTLAPTGVPSITFDPEKREKAAVSAREEQLGLLRNLTQAGIDPHLFDLMLSSELDRNLKKQFGAAFLLATVFFTLLSYGVIVLNGVFKWGISDIAITALVVETPIQFIGLLYIIARNLFPQRPSMSGIASGIMQIENASSREALSGQPRSRKKEAKAPTDDAGP